MHNIRKICGNRINNTLNIDILFRQNEQFIKDICEAERLEPTNRVIKRYRIRLQQEAENAGIILQKSTFQSIKSRFGSQESLGGISCTSESTIVQPPIPPPRVDRRRTTVTSTEKDVSEKETNQSSTDSAIFAPYRPKPMPRTNPFYSMNSYQQQPPPPKPPQVHLGRSFLIKQKNHFFTKQNIFHTILYLFLVTVR